MKCRTLPVLHGFSHSVKQDSEARETSVGVRHEMPNVAWESRTSPVFLYVRDNLPDRYCLKRYQSAEHNCSSITEEESLVFLL
jgi:hypothetical protein